MVAPILPMKETSMKFACTLFFGALIAAAMPALAQTTINSPTNGAEVTSPFTLNMTASTCSSLAVSAVGYSLDSSSQTSAWNADLY